MQLLHLAGEVSAHSIITKDESGGSFEQVKCVGDCIS